MKKPKYKNICLKICYLSFAVFMCSLLSQMYISNTTALKGKDFQHMHGEKEVLGKEIAILKFEDSRLSSLEYVEVKAKDLGFVEMLEPLLTVSSPSLASLATQ